MFRLHAKQNCPFFRMSRAKRGGEESRVKAEIVVVYIKQAGGKTELYSEHRFPSETPKKEGDSCDPLAYLTSRLPIMNNQHVIHMMKSYTEDPKKFLPIGRLSVFRSKYIHLLAFRRLQ